MKLPKFISVNQIMGFHYLSDNIGWVKVQLGPSLFLRVILSDTTVRRVENEWFDSLEDGLDRNIKIDIYLLRGIISPIFNFLADSPYRT